MTAHIIALGESAKQWDGTGFSIGVNDCFRNHKTDILLTVNNFNKEPERRAIIENSRPAEGLYSNLQTWGKHPDYKPLIIQRFKKGIEEGIIYHATTSPFIAVSLAFYLGYKRFVLWGVDFIDHRNVKGNKLKQEVKTYLSFNEQLKKHGAEMFLGVNYGAFENKLKTI